MRIKVKFFASYREAVGEDEVELDMADESDVSGLLEEVKEKYPALGDMLEPLVISVNRVYASPDTVLRHDDEVALLPPVSGG